MACSEHRSDHRRRLRERGSGAREPASRGVAEVIWRRAGSGAEDPLTGRVIRAAHGDAGLVGDDRVEIRRGLKPGEQSSWCDERPSSLTRGVTITAARSARTRSTTWCASRSPATFCAWRHRGGAAASARWDRSPCSGEELALSRNAHRDRGHRGFIDDDERVSSRSAGSTRSRFARSGARRTGSGDARSGSSCTLAEFKFRLFNPHGSSRGPSSRWHSLDARFRLFLARLMFVAGSWPGFTARTVQNGS